MYSNEDPEEQFEILEKIGEGAYASVYKGKHKNGQIVAIKIVPSTGEIQSLMSEIQILRECQSPYIVEYYGSFYKSGQLWLVMEYCAGGSIIDIMRITQKQLNEYEISAILYNVLLGIEYLHNNRKIHRDIKGGNILLDLQGQAKLADFGVSAQLTFTNADKGTVIGTPFWMSPEIISKNRYNHLTDIWSLGVTAIELAEGSPPYSHIHPVRAMFAIKNNPPQGLTNPESWTSEFNAFVKACLKVQVNERPSAAELLKMPFIRQGQFEQKRLLTIIQQSIEQLENFRAGIQQSKEQNEIITMISDQEPEEHSQGTIIECGTMIISDEQNIKKELDFVTYAKQQQLIDMAVDLHSKDINLDNLQIIPQPNAQQVTQELKNKSQSPLQSDKKYLIQRPAEITRQSESPISNKKQIISKPKVREEKEESDEQQIDKMTLEERKRFLTFLKSQMDEEIRQIRQKYQPKIDLLISKSQPAKIKQEINLPFNFQVNSELLNKISNIKVPQSKLQTATSPKSSQLRTNPKPRSLPFEFTPSIQHKHY